MQSMEELRKICQKPNYKKVGNFMARHITRDQALYVTRFLLPTGISANQVTLLSMVTGVIAALFFIPSNKWFFFTGALLLQLWYILDHVDGQIARYRNQSSLTGMFFDFIASDKTGDIKVFLGPCIRQCCYQIDTMLAADFKDRFGGGGYLTEREGSHYLDLAGINKGLLRGFGIREENIFDTGICTCCSRNYYSYRRQGVTGRQAAIAMLF